MKKPSSRSQRGSKGIKGKHILQICVLLGVCIWLIYQVKYSHDKKKECYEADGKKLSEREDGLVKLGRKDLLPGYHKNEKENRVEEDEDEEEIDHGEAEKEGKSKVENGGTHEEEEKEEEDEVAEEDEEDKTKLGEEVVEEDEDENKHEEDEIDEQDHSRTTGDKDDESLEDEKESDEKEKETNHADETDMTVDEAREEHYKADDASSAVSHESRILNTKKLKESSDNSTGTAQENNTNTNATVSEVEVQKEPILKLGEAKSGEIVDKTTTEVKDGDSESSNAEAKSLVTESRGETFNGNSTEAILEASGFLQNETKIMQERSQEDGAPPSGYPGVQTVVKLEQTRDESAPNITVSANITNIDSIQADSRNSTSESSVTENISGSNTTEVKENSRSEGDDETGEKDSSNHFSTEQTEEEADDTSESTILQEEREALTDPQTLPGIRIEGNEDDEEAISE